MRSERTRVPPVTPERSPPASRMTGADSPVMADSSIEATPSTISPSLGITSPATISTRSPERRAVETVVFDAAVGAQAAGRRRTPRLPQGIGLGLATRLGNRRGEIGKQQRRHQPAVQGQQIANVRPCTGTAQQLGHCIDQGQHRADFDGEHHRVFPLDVGPQHDQRLPKAALSNVGSNSPARRLWRRASFSSCGEGPSCTPVVSPKSIRSVSFSSSAACGRTETRWASPPARNMPILVASNIARTLLPAKRNRSQVLGDWPQGGHRQEQQCPDRIMVPNRRNPKVSVSRPHRAHGERRRLLPRPGWRPGPEERSPG